MEKYIIAGREYDVKEHDPVRNLPIVDVPMMSDERWNQLCRESTLENYRKYSGRGEAPDYETALKWEKEFFESDKPVENIKAPRIRQDTQGATIIDF